MNSKTKDSGPSEKMELPMERSHSMADAERVTTKNTDAVELANLGYKDELQRRFSLPSLLGLCLCLMGTWEACSASIAAALTSGGAPCLWYNFMLSFLFTLAIGASLAEIASIYPTSGGKYSNKALHATRSRLGTEKRLKTYLGQYHWVTALSPDRGRKTASWLTGWISIGGQVVLLASAGFYSSFMVQGLISLGNPSYHPERWHATLIYIGILIYCAMLNIIGERVLPTANFISGALHIFGFLAVLIALGVTSKKNTSGYVFTTTFNNTNWNDGVAWIVGMISSIYPFLGYDGACHLAEELPHPRRNVPLAMIGSIAINGAMGVGYVTMLLFSAGSLDRILATPYRLPFIQIYYDATHSVVGTTFMVLVSALTAIAAAAAGMTSASRTLWSFARDDATPFHSWIGHIQPKLKIPVNAVLVVFVLDLLLGLLYLVNPTASNAILSMSATGMYLSYLMPVACMLIWGRSKLQPSDYGPFKLGKVLGIFLNLAAIIWMVFSIIFSLFPGSLPVTSENMNYSVAVMSGWIILGAVHFALIGRKKFKMPVVAATVVEGMEVK
ncbi:hypothetical protein BFJ68_g9716 [Fusarium oxysporum]|uniref:Choline transport protein n=1 Tax=Fusarium oxysporum TaxID=5507 RepID=A0A420PD04_FUSOX|nr:hypothetical protein BFJ71_g11672 [Fusarium oxysporum]RKL07917.1 hypothetical protein BFJ68_g9716 [Fusarium oxysporum]